MARGSVYMNKMMRLRVDAYASKIGCTSSSLLQYVMNNYLDSIGADKPAGYDNPRSWGPMKHTPNYVYPRLRKRASAKDEGKKLRIVREDEV